MEASSNNLVSKQQQRDRQNNFSVQSDVDILIRCLSPNQLLGNPAETNASSPLKIAQDKVYTLIQQEKLTPEQLSLVVRMMRVYYPVITELPHDIVFSIGSEEIKANSFFLAAAGGPYLNALVTTAQNGRIDLGALGHIEAKAFKLILAYLNEGQLPQVRDANDYHELIVLAHRLGLDDLVQLCDDALSKANHLDSKYYPQYLGDLWGLNEDSLRRLYLQVPHPKLWKRLDQECDSMKNRYKYLVDSSHPIQATPKDSASKVNTCKLKFDNEQVVVADADDLREHSAYFKSLLSGTFREQGDSEIKIKDVHSQDFILLQKMRQSSPVRVLHVGFNDLLKFARLARRFAFDDLLPMMEVSLCNMVTEETDVALVQAAFELNFPHLLDLAMASLRRNGYPVTATRTSGRQFLLQQRCGTALTAENLTVANIFKQRVVEAKLITATESVRGRLRDLASRTISASQTAADIAYELAKMAGEISTLNPALIAPLLDLGLMAFSTAAINTYSQNNLYATDSFILNGIRYVILFGAVFTLRERFEDYLPINTFHNTVNFFLRPVHRTFNPFVQRVVMNPLQSGLTALAGLIRPVANSVLKGVSRLLSQPTDPDLTAALPHTLETLDLTAYQLTDAHLAQLMNGKTIENL